jgi:hypothetical protein
MIGIEQAEEDAFRAWVARVVNGVVALAEPAAVHLVELDHWFDDKWLGFSGKTLGAVGVSATDLTVPPFHPHRVRREAHYSRVSTGGYSLVVPPPSLHREQPSEHNLQRRLRVVAPATACSWYSGDATAMGRGSLMAYLPSESGPTGWYAGVKRAEAGWCTTVLTGITASELAVCEERRAG